jgi:GNAT superfamily N-acetyltransferase
MITIREITAAETFAVRQPVLRPGKPIESCIFEGDDLPTTIHLGIYDKGSLAGILSIFEAANAAFLEMNQFQLRGMAVLPGHQKKGLGEQLVQVAEKMVLDRQGELIWFNAREAAVGFYSRMGYEISGEMFSIPDVGPHYVMFKKLR